MISKYKMLLKYTSIPHWNEAVTHPSYRKLHPHIKYDNQRLELLGDSILNFVITDYLYHRYKHYHEGYLTKIRIYLICSETIIDIALDLYLGNFLLKNNKITISNSIYEDTFESILGAIYLDCGIEEVRSFILDIYKEELDNLNLDSVNRDYKGILQEYTHQLEGIDQPFYETLMVNDITHKPIFDSTVYIDGKKISCGSGKSKKIAELNAAHNALKLLKLIK